METDNGAAPGDPLDAYATELEALLAPLASERERVEAQLSALVLREHKIKALLEITRAEDLAAVIEPPKKQKKPKDDWVPRQVVIDEIYAALVKCGEPMTVNGLARIVLHSPDSTRRAMEALRSVDRVRIAGKSRGGGRLYMVMP
jgi:hypothetical protein